MKKNFLLVFISTIFTILIINFIIIFFANNIFYQKNFPRTLLNFFSKYYALFYPDINYRTFNNYTAVIGDSVAFGSGDEYLDKSYNYSISHKIRKEHNKYNFVNFVYPINVIDEKIKDLSNEILLNSPIGLKCAKKSIISTSDFL